MNSDTIIAERIKQKRTELKMTQRDLAKAAQTTPATISAYEKAQKKPSIDNMMKIAEVFNVSIDWLCGKEAAKAIKTLRDVVEIILTLEKYISINAESGFPEDFVLSIEPEFLPYNCQNAFIKFFTELYQIQKLSNVDYSLCKQMETLWISEELKNLEKFKISDKDSDSIL